MSVRASAVAGMFYPANASALRRQIEECFLSPRGPGKLPEVRTGGERRILGLVSPHAGYIYSGSVAAHAYSRLAEDGLPDVAVILGPNHRSYRPPAALSGDTAWLTPLGEMAVDLEVSGRIAAAYPEVTFDSAAHYAEHSLEVQLPFLQYLAESAGTDIRVVPILIGASAQADALRFAGDLGSAIASAFEGENAVIIASTDFTHYESAEAAESKDSSAISAILALDEDRLLSAVEEFDMSMCGVLPTAVEIAACKKLGAASARRLSYSNSGDVTGDYREVVGYASLELLA